MSAFKTIQAAQASVELKYGNTSLSIKVKFERLCVVKGVWGLSRKTTNYIVDQ
jgi:hypothetical protein